MTGPVVSVILPTYNRAWALPRSIESILHQTFSDFELIIIDDGSTDDTEAVVSKYNDPRIRYHKLDPNQGVCVARNTGLELATAPYVAFQDSDDFWLPQNLELKLDALEKADDDVGAVIAGRLQYGIDDNYQVGERRVVYVPEESRGSVTGDIYNKLLENNLFATTMIMVKREIILDTGGFDLSLRMNDDWDIALALAKRTKFTFVHQPVMVSFLSDDSISQQVYIKTTSHAKVVEKHKDALEKLPTIYARHLYYIGRRLTDLGAIKKARTYFYRAAAADPLNWRVWIGLILTWGPSSLVSKQIAMDQGAEHELREAT